MPTTVFTDNFNRANQDLTASANYVGVENYNPASNSFDIVSNVLLANGASTPLAAGTTTSAHAALSEVHAGITRRSASGFDGGPAARLNAGSTNYYYLDMYGSNNFEIYRVNGGTHTLVASRNVTHANNDTMAIEVTGTGATVTMKAIRNGSQQGSNVTDSSGTRITAAGQTGLVCWALPSSFDDFIVQNLAIHQESVSSTLVLTQDEDSNRFVEQSVSSTLVLVSLGLNVEEHEEAVTSVLSLSGVSAPKAFRVPLYLKNDGIRTRVVRLPPNEFIAGIDVSAISEFLTDNIADESSLTYYYFGGNDVNGNWKINRYHKITLIKTSANQTTNASYSTLSAAWADRTTLTYT